MPAGRQLILPGQKGRAGSIIDFPAVVDTVVAPSTYGNPFIVGVAWPLLANQIVKIFNASALLVLDDSSREVVVDNLVVQLVIQDAGGATLAEFALAQMNSGQTIVGPTGVAATAHGDPVVAFLSNILIAGVQGIAAQFQLQASADVFNNDAVNPHTAEIFLTGIFDFMQ